MTTLLVSGGLISFSPAHASIDTWQKGASVEPRWTTDFGSATFKQSIDNLAKTHANYVSLIIPYYQSNAYSTDIQPGWNTPTDDSLAQGIQYIHSKGMKVMLVIHLESYDGQWRAQINPGDRATWYANYSAMLNHVATIAAAQSAESLIIGAELIDMASQMQYSDNGTQWSTMIDRVRAIYNGQLSYSANWGDGGWFDEKDNINFWNKLDFIGISAYFNLNSGGDVPSLKGAWDYWNDREIRGLQQRWNKPIVFTEVGYKSVSGAHYQPWDYNRGGAADQTEQANDYQALFDYWNTQPFFAGVQLWNWSTDPNAGWGSTDYTPQHKAAEQVMTQWFGATAASISPAPSNVSFSSSGGPNTMSPLTNQPVSLRAQIQNMGATMNNLIVDLEVRDQNNQKVFQQAYENQNFPASQFNQYTASWTPTAPGQYRYVIGVFNSNWTVAYHWNDNAATFFVGQGTQPTPTPTPTPSPTGTPTPTPTPSPTPAPSNSGTTLDVWWPTSGATVTGLQPFKAMIEDREVAQYNMYWQVDGDQLNSMATNNTDYPHKQALVDLSGWNWNASGLYHLNFVAKDLSGSLINQKSVDIHTK